MATYDVNGKSYEFPDAMPPDQAFGIIQQMGSQQAPQEQAGATAPAQPTAQPQAQPSAKLPADLHFDPDMLNYNKDFVNASKVFWEWSNKAEHENDIRNGVHKDDKFYSEYGRDQVGWMNNTGVFAADVARLSSDKVPLEVKKAYATLMEYGGHFDYSVGGATRAGIAMITDPTNWVGLASLGIGTGVGQGVKMLTREAFKRELKAAITRQALVTGFEGGALTATNDVIRQQAEINAQNQSEIDVSQVGKAGAVGAALGGVLGGAAATVGTVLRKATGKAAEAEAGNAVGRTGEALPAAGEAPKAPSAAPVPSGPVKPTLHPEDHPIYTAEPNKGLATVEYKGERFHGTDHAEAIEKAVEKHGPAMDNALVSGEAKVGWLDKGEQDAYVAHLNNQPKGAQGHSTSDIMDAIKAAADDTGGRLFIRPLAEIKAAADPAVKHVETLVNMTGHDVNRAIEDVRRAAVTPEQKQVLDATFKYAYENLEHSFQNLRSNWKAMAEGAAKDAVREELDKVKKIRDLIKPADTDMSSGAGSMLGYRKGGLNTNEWRDVSEESILREMGVDPAKATSEQISQAEQKYADMYHERVTSMQNNSMLKDYEKQINTAFDNGDYALANKLSADRKLLQEKMLSTDAEGQRSIGQWGRDLGKDAANKAVEYTISTVFSPATVIRNTIPSLMKTVYRPALDMIIRGPMEMEHRVQMMAQYAAMWNFRDVSMRAALMSWKIERGLINGDFNIATEGMAPAFKGKFGQILRTFPRILGATDELFQQLNYRGFVAAQAAGDAMKFGSARGMEGKALKDFAMQRAMDAVDAAFEKPRGVYVLDMLRQKGMEQGIPVGPKLDAWVKTMLDKDGDLFRTALNQSAKDYSDDILFKRAFSGTNKASEAASAYEHFVNNNPWMRLMGQLFFRTPVRVFEEGIRLTPGLNLVSGAFVGNFVKDLKGLNGAGPQMRAHGELMLSYAIGMSVFSMYAQGKITGGGDKDWRLRRQMEDGKTWEPYTMYFGDHKFDFRNWDPFATPFKILVNALDKYGTIQYRQAQGEYLGAEEQKAMAYVGMGMVSIAQAVRDANLWQGLDQLVQFGQDIADPENKSSSLMKFLGQKAKLAVPNTFTKIQAFDHPELNDGANPQDYIRAAINPSDPRVSKRVDAFGEVVKNDNPWGGLLGIDFTKRDEGGDKIKLANGEMIKALTVATGGKFLMPYTVDYFGWSGTDLRTEFVKDGSESYYNRLNRYVSTERLNGKSLQQAFYEKVTNRDKLAVGTPSDPAAKAQVAMAILNTYRKAAFHRLLEEEHNLKPKLLENARSTADAMKGKRDATGQPFNVGK